MSRSENQNRNVRQLIDGERVRKLYGEKRMSLRAVADELGTAPTRSAAKCSGSGSPPRGRGEAEVRPARFAGGRGTFPHRARAVPGAPVVGPAQGRPPARLQGQGRACRRNYLSRRASCLMNEESFNKKGRGCDNRGPNAKALMNSEAGGSGSPAFSLRISYKIATRDRVVHAQNPR